MAVAKTGAIYKTFTFDGYKSSNYGVYITGQAVFNAPERAVEMITIPGRDGAFAQDQGRFENIEVTYPAGIFADTESDFADAISDFRNILCSREGYCRLIDDYNPSEYRMAIYKSGLEVSPAQLKAGEFNITFECQPQRFLASGETKSTLSSPATVNNPTRFPSKPLIEATGTGNITINGEIIKLNNEPIGWIQVGRITDQATYDIDDTYAVSGDAINIEDVGLQIMTGPNDGASSFSIASAIASTSSSGVHPYVETSKHMPYAFITLGAKDIPFVYGTSATKSMSLSVTFNSTTYGQETMTASLSIAYNGAKGFTISSTYTQAAHYASGGIQGRGMGPFMLDSSAPSLGAPTYIDLSIGEAYKIVNNTPISANAGVTIPAELPVLKPGANTITFPNTFTKVEIIPRWWKV